MKLVLEATMVLALLVGGYTYLTQKESKESNNLKETIIDQDAYIHELQAQIARNDAIIHVMEDGATKRQAEHVVDSASAYGVELK